MTGKPVALRELVATYRAGPSAGDVRFRRIVRPELAAAAARVFLDNLADEHHLCLYLSARYDVICYRLRAGGATCAYVDARSVMRDALLGSAQGLITAHNHPSGEVEPSDEDRSLRSTIAAFCEVMNIDYVDDLIIGRSPTGEPRVYSAIESREMPHVKEKAAAVVRGLRGTL